MEEPVVLSDVESDDSEALYNPLKLPMGWDGKTNSLLVIQTAWTWCGI